VDLETYVRTRKEQLGRSARNVKDFSVFDFNYVPEQPLMRDECGRLIDAMLRFDVSGIPTHHAIIGSRGSGKTLTVRFLQRLVPQQTDLRFLYANCRTHNTSFKILAHLLGGERTGSKPQRTVRAFSRVLLRENGVGAG
jgi:Cdc6-like AAA superfamily ATPase